MEKLCPDRYKQKDKYLIILDRVTEHLFEAYQHIVRGSEWCNLRPSLADEFEESSEPSSAPKVDPVSVERHGVSPAVKAGVQVAKVLPLPLKARPKLPPASEKRLRQEDVDNASSPPSSTPSPPPPPKKLPPPPPYPGSAGGPKAPPWVPPFPSVPAFAAKASSVPNPQPPPPPAPVLARPKEPSLPPPPSRVFSNRPKEPSHPPPSRRVDDMPREPSYPPPGHAYRTNRWNRGDQQTPRKGMASEKEDPKTNDASIMPLPDKEDIEQHEKYVKYVKTVVQKWLMETEDDLKKRNPKYQRTALTNFLFMTLVSSFLEVAKDAAMMAYKNLRGHRNYYFQDSKWQSIEAMTMKTWVAHGRTGHIWKFMNETLSVQNFTPEDPGDIEKWKNWLSKEQVRKTMEWLFNECWRDRPDKRDPKRLQLLDHTDALWEWYKHLETVQLVNEGIYDPWPSCWTWPGFMKRERLKCVEQATNLFRHKIGDAESLAKMHTKTFAWKIKQMQDPE